mmetsp:Transcript_35090/g.29620  ORF Transcript_35090/g.29620 Transcript_35090/m.29620 type:complete len:109 (+) Transcript_35090:498-824(+)
MIWGLGTAIGELPPYFMAKLGSIEENESSSPTFKSFGRIIKGNFGFFFVIVMAGIPNPLFDLAGLACGYYGVSFWGFLIPTIIGKAVIKAGGQTFATVFLFFSSDIQI